MHISNALSRNYEDLVEREVLWAVVENTEMVLKADQMFEFFKTNQKRRKFSTRNEFLFRIHQVSTNIDPSIVAEMH